MKIAQPIPADDLPCPSRRKSPGRTWVSPTKRDFAADSPPKKINFRFPEPLALADFLQVERTRLAPQAHFFRLCPAHAVVSGQAPPSGICRLASILANRCDYAETGFLDCLLLDL
jgi:hypothetical protein